MLSRAHRLSPLMFVLLLTAIAAVAPLSAQERPASAPPAPTADDYARAEKFLAPALTSLVVGGSVSPAWLPDDRFTYRSTTADGVQFLLVDPVKATRVPAFDHVKLAAALGAAAGGTFDPKKLPFQAIELSADGKSVAFDVEARRWSCDVAGTACKDAGAAGGGRGGEEGGRGAGRGGGAGNAVASPDGKRAVFIKDWNLWVRDVATGQEKALTTDGVENFGYATDNAGWRRSDRAIVLWSPDSKKVATFQQDERKVGDMYLVETKAGHPVLHQWKYPLPGDEHVAMLHRVIIDVDTGATVRFKMEPDYHRATLGDNFSLQRHDSGVPTPRSWRSCRPRATTSRPCSAWPTRRRATCARCSRKPWPRTSSRAPAGGCCGRQARSSGTRSATTGATSISTTSPPGTLKNRITSGEGPRQPDRPPRREDPHRLLSSRWGARRGRTRTSGTPTGSGSTARASCR